jgi:hypothetical protein
VTEIDVEWLHAGGAKDLGHQSDHLDIAFDATMAIKLGAHLQRVARAFATLGSGAQHGAAVAKPHRPFAAQLMRIDTSRLRGDIGTHPHHASTHLVGELEGLQVKIMGNAREQGLEVFDDRGHHQLVAPARAALER